jgi:alpha-L-fucosidase
LAGVPYDGANSNYWDLYHFPAQPGDTGWYSKDPRWQQQWYNEIKELVDNYHPELLYSDGGVAFGNEVGLSQIANLYNDNMQHNDGKLTAVYNCKQPSGGRWVQDYERGVNGGIDPNPWQTDTSIGDWFYNRHWKYQPLSWTVHMLVDIVSKNGNLLLNIPVRGNGTLDDDELKFLAGLTRWMDVNSESIYGTRPWRVYGEGRTDKAGKFVNNGQDRPYAGSDIRFAGKGDVLYATFLAWPGQRAVVRSLATSAVSGKVTNVSLLGHAGKLKWEQTKDGLEVAMPAEKPCEHAFVLKIAGKDLIVPVGNKERQ